MKSLYGIDESSRLAKNAKCLLFAWMLINLSVVVWLPLYANCGGLLLVRDSHVLSSGFSVLSLAKPKCP